MMGELVADQSALIAKKRFEVARIRRQIEDSNFYDDPPSVVERLSDQLEAAQSEVDVLIRKGNEE